MFQHCMTTWNSSSLRGARWFCHLLMDDAGLDVAAFHVIEEDHIIAADAVEPHTGGCKEVSMHAMDAKTAQSSDHWWLQRRPSMDDDMSLPGSHSAKGESEEQVSKVNELTLCVNALEEVMSTVRQAHEVAPTREVQLCHCSTLHCSRVANAAGFHTCCSKCSNWGPHHHTHECHGRQTFAIKTLVERQQLLETIMAKVDEIPPGVKAELPRCTTRNS